VVKEKAVSSWGAVLVGVGDCKAFQLSIDPGTP
jgi:hypothetical protein